MKLKSTITAALLLIAPLYANGQVPSGYGDRDPYIAQPQSLPRRADTIPTGAQIEMKMIQIELDVALKQFEKLETTLADARSEMQLLDEGTLGEKSHEELLSRAQRKFERVSRLKAGLQDEIRRKVGEIDVYRQKYSITDAPVPYIANPNITGPRREPTLTRLPDTETLPAPSFNGAKPAPAKQADEVPRTPTSGAPATPFNQPVAR